MNDSARRYNARKEKKTGVASILWRCLATLMRLAVFIMGV